MSICVPRWYWDEMQEIALPTTHERNTMSETMTQVSTEDFNEAMRLLGLLVDPDVAIMSVEIREGAVMAEYRQRVKVGSTSGLQIKRGGPQWPVPDSADGFGSTDIRTSRDGKVPSDGQFTT